MSKKSRRRQKVTLAKTVIQSSPTELDETPTSSSRSKVFSLTTYVIIIAVLLAIVAAFVRAWPSNLEEEISKNITSCYEQCQDNPDLNSCLNTCRSQQLEDIGAALKK